MAFSVHDVAACILQKQGAMSPMKLQKLVYYAQAWSLVWDDRPMFDEPIMAWAYGPVVNALYQRHKGKYTVNGWDGDPEQLDESALNTIDAVLRTYGDKGPFWLSELTHSERPWKETHEQHQLPDGWCDAEIPRELIREFYSDLYWSQF